MADSNENRSMRLCPCHLIFCLCLVHVQLGCTHRSSANVSFAFDDLEGKSTRVMERYKFFIDTPFCTEEGVSGVQRLRICGFSTCKKAKTYWYRYRA